MSLTVFTHTYNGGTLYPLQFELGYIVEAHVYVYAGDDSAYETQLAYTWADSNTIQLVAPFPALGTEFKIRRVVPRNDLLGYFEGTRIRSTVLDDVNKQLLMIAQELADGYTGDEGGGGTPIRGILDMNGNRIINVGAPEDDFDAIRLIDITGGVTEPKGVQFQNDDTYVQLDNAVPTPVADGDMCSMVMSCKLHSTVLPKTLLVAADGTHCGLASDNSIFYLLDSDGSLQSVELTGFTIPSDVELILSIETRLDAGVLQMRLSHDVNSTAWLSWKSSMDWARFFGGVAVETGVGITIYAQTYNYAGLVNNWDYANQQGRTILSTNATYIGTIFGDNWQPIEDEPITVPISVSAEEVAFVPFGTSFPETAQDVNAVLRNIDTNFVRAGAPEENPDPIDGTPLAVYRTWLVDTSVAARTRPLPASPLDGDWVVIRDNKGGIVDGLTVVRPITVGRNGNTIMGLSEDLVFNTNWTWAKVQWFEALNDWVVVEGGVGGQVRFIPLDVAERVYPIGHVIFSMNATNPADYLQFGTWRRVASGMFIVGQGTLSDDNKIPRTFVTRENNGAWEQLIRPENLPSDATVTLTVRSDNGENSGGEDYASADDPSSRTMKGTLDGGDVPIDVTSPSFGMFIFERIA